MRSTWSKHLVFTFFVCALTGVVLAQNGGFTGSEFKLTSTTFPNDGTMPVSTVYTVPSSTNAAVNICTANGAPGGNQSPELSWSGAPWETRSFVVVLYDVTASFTHWGMYNIAPQVHSLPMNAGVNGSSYGTEVVNDFGNAQYDGPCPPAGVAPLAHQYVFTVYALSTQLTLSTPPNFPANAETLYHALIEAARKQQILASASWTGFYSSTPSSQ